MSERNEDTESFKTCDDRTYISESSVSYSRESDVSAENRPMSHIIRLETTIASLREKVLQLELQQNNDLTQDDLEKLSSKKMLQKIDTYEHGWQNLSN